MLAKAGPGRADGAPAAQTAALVAIRKARRLGSMRDKN